MHKWEYGVMVNVQVNMTLQTSNMYITKTNQNNSKKIPDVI